MSKETTIGQITGAMFLQIAGGEPVEVGKVHLPLIALPSSNSDRHFEVSLGGHLKHHESDSVALSEQDVAELAQVIWRSLLERQMERYKVYTQETAEAAARAAVEWFNSQGAKE